MGWCRSARRAAFAQCVAAVASIHDYTRVARHVGRDQAEPHVGGDALGLALQRIAVAATARQLEQQALAGPRRPSCLPSKRRPDIRPKLPAAPWLAAVVLARRNSTRSIVPADMIGGRPRRGADLDRLAEPAAEFSRTTGAFTKLAAIKDHRRDRFPSLSTGIVRTPRRKRRCRQPVLAGPRAGTAAVKDHGRTAAACWRRCPPRLRPPVNRRRKSADSTARMRPRPARRRRSPDAGSPNHVRQHLADRVARGDRPRPLGVEHGAFRRAHRDRLRANRHYWARRARPGICTPKAV